jgi:hypothetical protein
MSTTHHLKSWPQFFRPIREGKRTHELRRNDRGFAIGDLLILHEFDPATQLFTGQACEVEVTSITSFAEPCAVSDVAMNPEFCIMSVRIHASLQPARQVGHVAGIERLH